MIFFFACWTNLECLGNHKLLITLKDIMFKTWPYCITQHMEHFNLIMLSIGVILELIPHPQKHNNISSLQKNIQRRQSQCHFIVSIFKVSWLLNSIRIMTPWNSRNLSYYCLHMELAFETRLATLSPSNNIYSYLLFTSIASPKQSSE